MTRSRGVIFFGSMLIAVTSVALPAHAELYKRAAQGLGLLDFQFSGQRNPFGDGLTVNTAASYNNRTFDFGVAQLTLNGGVTASAGFTKRGIPSANFALNAGSLGSPMNYNFTINNGFEDVNVTGTALVNVRTNINLLGFYDQNIQISNRAVSTMDGLVEDLDNLDFDLGPINKSGNAYLDILAKVTDPIFQASGNENFFKKLSNQATRVVDSTKSLTNLQAKVASGEILSDAEMAQLINQSILTAVLGGNTQGSVFNIGQTSSTEVFAPVSVPEPTLLVSLSLMFGAITRRRRKP